MFHDRGSASTVAWTAESSHRGTSKQTALEMAENFWNSKASPTVTNLLQEGHTSQSFPNSSTSWGPSLQTSEPVGGSPIHTATMCLWGSMCGYVHMNDGPCRGQRCRIPWSESFRQLWAFICRYWELNSGPLQEQYTLLTTKPSLQPAQVFLTYLCVFPGCGTEVMNTFGTSNSLSSNVGSTFHLV